MIFLFYPRARSSVARYPATYRERDATLISLSLSLCHIDASSVQMYFGGWS